jgi:hypothetical protein
VESRMIVAWRCVSDDHSGSWGLGSRDWGRERRDEGGTST